MLSHDPIALTQPLVKVLLWGAPVISSIRELASSNLPSLWLTGIISLPSSQPESLNNHLTSKMGTWSWFMFVQNSTQDIEATPRSQWGTTCFCPQESWEIIWPPEESLRRPGYKSLIPSHALQEGDDPLQQTWDSSQESRSQENNRNRQTRAGLKPVTLPHGGRCASKCSGVQYGLHGCSHHRGSLKELPGSWPFVLPALGSLEIDGCSTFCSLLERQKSRDVQSLGKVTQLISRWELRWKPKSLDS